jgi:hypothetical protein
MRRVKAAPSAHIPPSLRTNAHKNEGGDGDRKEWRSRSASLVAVGAAGRRKQRRKGGAGEAASEARVNLCTICTPRTRVELEEEQGRSA